MPRPTCAIQVVFHIKPERVDDFRAVVLRQARNSLEKEPWCHQFDVCTNPEQPNSFLLYETYDDREAIAKHRGTPHFAEFSRTVQDWVESKESAVWDIVVP